jgi:hypothetical protein
MRKSSLTREQAIERCGIDAVKKVESENCDFTNRVDVDLDLEGVIEFSASVEARDLKDDNLCVLTAYYYADKDQVENCDGDLGSVDWEIHTYTID